MKLDAAEIKRRLEAAQSLLSGTSTTLERVQSAAALLKGINKKLDGLAVAAEKNCARLELATSGAYVELAANALPDETPEQKRRKKALLFFIKSYDDLKAEVARVQGELEQGHSVQDSTFWSNIMGAAVGPVAVITVAAVVIGVMSQTSVDVVIENEGCGTLIASGTNISIPGLVLPSEPIPSGSSATATIPPLTLTIDGTQAGNLNLSSLKLNFDIGLSDEVSEVTFNGEPLLGKVTEVTLSEQPSHTLTLYCNG